MQGGMSRPSGRWAGNEVRRRTESGDRDLSTGTHQVMNQHLAAREPAAPRVPAAQLEARLERTRAAMREQGIDCLVVAGKGLISHYGYLEYLLGFCPVVRTGYLVVPASSDAPVAVMSTRSDAYFAEALSVYEDVRVAGEGDVVGRTNTTGSAVVDVIRGWGLETGAIGVVGMGIIMPNQDVEDLHAGLPQATITDEAGLLGAIKAIKDPEEYPEIEAAGRVADAAFTAFIEAAKTTRKSWELYGEMERALRANGARDSLIFIGRGPYFLHRPFDEELAEGDLVTVYVETVAPNGYWVEKAGLFAYGDISDEQRAYADAAINSLQAAGEAMVPGATASDVARSLEAKFAHLDVRVGIWHGHGVGIDHDAPVIGVNDNTPLAEGMLIAVHPNLTNSDETVGASVADTFLIRDGQAEAISSVPQELRIIGN